jgi:TRAP transporter 4TM/12TM fusion protein
MDANVEKQTTFRKFIAVIIICLGVTMSCFHLYTAAIGSLPTMEQRSMHLCFVLVLIFLKSIAKRQNKLNIKDIVDISLATVGLIVTLYAFFLWQQMFMRAPFPTNTDVLIGVLLIIVVLEGTRRELGIIFPILGITFILYGLFGHMLPIASHKGFEFWRVVTYLTQATEGVYGTVLGVSATYIFLFILFGSLLKYSGASHFFVELSLALFGRARGGPAKVATVASGLFGMVSGSAVANVMAVGPFTIPMMTRLGYEPKFSGGVISVAGTGGQFMPPIMGAAAFIIAETLGISYLNVIIAAFIPAVLYYAALWFIVDIRAQKAGIKTLPPEEVPDWKSVFLGGFYLVAPLVLLVYFLAIIRWSPLKSGFWAIISLFVVSSFRKETRLTPRKIIQALSDGAMDSLNVAIICAAAGIIIGILSLTGLSLKFSQLLISLSMGIKPVLLILTMISALILGMGMTTTSVYIVLSVIVAPALTRMGVAPLAAHLFVFYFGILSAITPPVATASYAAASLTKSSPTELGFEGWRLGIAGYIIPFMFIYSPTLLMEGSIFGIARSTITAIIGIYALSASIEGYLYGNLSIFMRAILVVSSLSLIYAGLVTDIVGAVLFLSIFLFCKLKLNKASHHLEDQRK